jgi:hypothetical protein
MPPSTTTISPENQSNGEMWRYFIWETNIARIIAIMNAPVGVFSMEGGQPQLVDVVDYAAECVNPPEGVKSIDWIQGGFEGAQC